MSGSAHPDPTPEAAVGQRIGEHFVVEELLGRGGMGDVFRVRDTRNGAAFALKRLRIREPAKARALTSSFEREYYTLAELAHPRIIQVHDYGLDQHGPFYTMELLEGPDLRTQGRVPWRKACSLLRDVASSLAVLHARRLLYRDLSPRNVLYAADGRGKLIDFGAMIPMGVARQLVGTPPLVPPEALQQQLLDARADLYSLGALGYFLLTGRHAYPARTFDQLRDAYRTQPRPPHKVDREIPLALSALVMEALNLDRTARPGSAAELIERLTSIGGLATDNVGEISRAYIATPALVGRETALVEMRRKMLRSLRGGGGTLLVEGESGSGRSRFLDACVLDAKLMGAVVLRADAGDGARGDYGAASALCEQLLSHLPDAAREAARLRRPLLSQLVPELAASAEDDAPATAPAESERRHLQTALRDWFRSVARKQRLAIAVDDVDRIDEPSAALLAALAHRSDRRRLFVMVTAESTPEPGPAHALIGEVATRIGLSPLSHEETEALVRSLFAGSAGSAAMARRLYDLSQGNPRLIMELAEQMVDRGLSRYSGGTWLLAEGDGEGSVPESIAATLRARLFDLPGTARELAEVLSLTDPAALSVEQLPELLDPPDRGAAYRALDALLARGLLVAEGGGYRFSHREWGPLLAGGLPSSRARAFHARLAALAEPSGTPARLAHHLMESGQTRRAVDVLLAHRGDASFAYSRPTLCLLEQALAQREELKLPMHIQLRLELWLLAICSILSEAGSFLEHAPRVLERLTRDSGLADMHALAADPTVPAAEVLPRALAAAQARFDQTPEHDRGLQPVKAIEELSRTCATVVGLTAVTQDLTRLEALPSLSPLVPLSPALYVVHSLVIGMTHFNSGRIEEGRRVFIELSERLQSEELASMDGPLRREMGFGIHFVLGQIEAAMGLSSGPERVAELERHPSYRVNAWRVHATHHLMRGDAEEAQNCMRRAELFRLQDGNRQAYPGTTLRIEARAHWLAEDLIRVKETLERVQRMAERFEGWEVLAAVTRSHLQRLRGDAAAALAAVEPLLERWRPSRHLDWPSLAAAHVHALCALRRYTEAAEVGTGYIASCERERLHPNDADLLVGTAQALSMEGRRAEARELVDHLVRRCEAAGVQGLNLGQCYEARARLAMLADDREEFERWAKACAVEYRVSSNAALAAKHARLLQEASRFFADLSDMQASVAADGERGGDTSAATVISRMDECIDRGERGLCALTILLEETRASRGFLFGLVHGRLELLAAVPDERPPPQAAAFLEAYLEREVALTDTAMDLTVTETADCPPLTLHGHSYVPIVMRGTRGGEQLIGGVAAIHSGEPSFCLPGPGMIARLVTSLLEHDDIDPITQMA